jgi:hypothetical protein
VAIIPNNAIRSNAVPFLRKDEAVTIVVEAVTVAVVAVATAVAEKAVAGATAIAMVRTVIAEAASPPTRVGTTTPGAVADAVLTAAVDPARMNAVFTVT